jgi:regulator of sirC expression with transglutaminase-like and TPR domain
MRPPLDLPEWHALAALDDAAVPLLGTALLIARDEYPQLDADLYDTLLESHAEHLRQQIEAVEAWPLKMQAINRHLFEELGYAGDHDQYYDPRNSYLNEVFERRLGNPISLALVQMEVARRVGVPLDGVSFPGHFLVRLPMEDGVLVMDPFNRGRPLDLDELRERAKPHLGGDVPDDEAMGHILSPASHRGMLVRMLRNLHGVYAEAGDWERAVRCADRVLKLSPTNAESLRDRGLGYMQLGYAHGARHDVGRYLQLKPDAVDAASLREALIELGGGARPH